MLRFALSLVPLAAWAQGGLTPGTQPFVVETAPVMALTHARIIDGTGGPVLEDQTILIDSGKIKLAGKSVAIPAGARTIDLTNHTVFPGIVGMHEHLFYPSGGVPVYNQQAYTAPRLYLASGVTTARTGGSLEPYTDLNLKQLIDGGRMPGPKLFVTGPYLEGKGPAVPQMHALADAEDARRTVEYWAAEGVTSLKAYMNITRAELAAAIETAHQHGIKVTGHLCSIGFREAAALGIDNLEHGLVTDTEFNPGKKPDICENRDTLPVISKLDLASGRAREMIGDLVSHHVAITSTLAVFEALMGDRPPLQQRALEAMSPQAATAYLATRARAAESGGALSLQRLKKEMEFEREFVKAGGLLMAGADPTGNGGALPGFADQRNIELLVEAGFTPAEAIRIATLNGALWLGEADHIGTIQEGKQADLVVVEGNPASRIADVEKVRLVFKDGIGYDPGKLLETVRGRVGIQ